MAASSSLPDSPIAIPADRHLKHFRGDKCQNPLARVLWIGVQKPRRLTPAFSQNRFVAFSLNTLTIEDGFHLKERSIYRS
jgi:hypothetical protein